MAHCLETAVADSDLSVLSVDATKGSSLVVGELIHCALGEVEAVGGVVHSKDVDGLSVVGDAVAGTALVRLLVVLEGRGKWKHIPEGCSIQQHPCSHQCEGNEGSRPEFASRAW